MHVKQQENFSIRIQHALNLPVRMRCAELTVLLERGSLLELHNFFPVLVDSIFGPQGTVSWGLRTTTEFQGEDFRQLQHFLSPCGPLFKLIYTLLKDPSARYDFPIVYLPTKIRYFLEQSHVHPFYSELSHTNPQTKVTSILLNPFDYYIFHFAYHLINPWQQRGGSTATSWNTVYYVLCCDYIIQFLPTDPGATVQPVIYYNGKNPLQAVKCNLLEQYTRSPVGLINSNMLTKVKDDSFQNNLDIHHPRNDIWRSETILTVFTDMWLHNDQVNESSNSFNSSFNNPSPVKSFHHNELPTGEYMRIVRVLIKQLHSFHASAKADDTHLGELKKISIPMIQGKFYIFLRNLIHRWPLDGSFRLVLELWLTYIQPWRYPANNLIKQINTRYANPDVEDISAVPQAGVEQEFLPFIAENLLSYVVILQQLLPRFGRVDLVSPKMALMLYRIAKVFDQPNLPNFLREVEQCVENNNSPSHKYDNNHWGNSLPPLSPTSNWSSNTRMKNRSKSGSLQNTTFSPNSNSTSFLSTSLHSDKKWSATVRQRIFELEGPNFYYKPLFSDPPAPEIFDLIMHIKKSIRRAEELVRLKEQEEQEMYSGFWGNLKYFFQSPASNDEFSLKDRQKVPMYLQVSLHNLMDMFNITTEVSEEPTSPSACTTNTFDMSDNYKFLTPKMVRTRIKNLKYDGNPDLHPIRSTENAFLVRTLYQIASKVNEIYGPQFYQLYHSPTFLGRLSKEILCSPITVYHYDKSISGSPRVSSNLPPRVSFRFMASYTFLGYFFFGAFISYLFGYRIEIYVAFILFLFLFYKSLKAIRIRDSSVRHNYPTQGFGNITFNDSF
ncbi:sphingomyelin phosphodiesterase 4 isoform X1 [Leptinotarsa decemlineata]|uniref:sphingomyelin phosphodiesterase 4 isoform X1 n=2 Tax=Leptinotarsa decemlineata TaxID=7539 RepID=UPI003D309704